MCSTSHRSDIGEWVQFPQSVSSFSRLTTEATMFFVTLFLFCLTTAHEELNRHSPYYRVSIADAYHFGITFEVAKAQYHHADKLHDVLRNWACENQHKLDADGRAQLDAAIEHQLYRERAWRKLASALDPTRDFKDRREALANLREYLGVLGGGVTEYWNYRLMPSPVFD